jgi:hypothetical protein
MMLSPIHRIVSDPVEARNRVPGPTTFDSPWKRRDGTANDPNSSTPTDLLRSRDDKLLPRFGEKQRCSSFSSPPAGFRRSYRILGSLASEEGSVKPPASSLRIDEKPTPRFFVRMLVREH